MRLRIAHQLALLLSAAVVLAVLVVGTLSLWNLRSGFMDYLKARDEEQLMRLVQLIERRASADPSMEWLRDNRPAMRELMDELYGRTARGQRPPPPRPWGPPGPPPGDGDGPPPPPPHPADAPPAGNLAERVLIRDPQGHRLEGRPQPPDAQRTVRAVKVNGATVAFVEMIPEPEPEGLDARFLKRQYLGLAGAAGGTVLLCVLAGWWVAGRWSRPLQLLQRATREIAQGRHEVALVPAGAREIAQLMEDVNHMGAELARLESTRRAWIAQISHELRTPLSVLRGEIESIEDGARQPTPQVMAGLHDEVMQLGRLVDDLHTLSVADMNGLRCDFAPGDAHAALWRVAHRFEAQAAQRGLLLQLPAADGTPIAACWDFGRIEQLLSNLLGNSLRYTDAPGTVHINWHNAGQALVLTVEDSAPGVSAADLPRLFEPLFRADRARQRGREHGSGLGLSIARSIVQSHGGSISASASALGGLCMTVRLPLQPPGSAR